MGITVVTRNSQIARSQVREPEVAKVCNPVIGVVDRAAAR